MTDGQARRFGQWNEKNGEPIELESSSYRRGLPDRIVRYACVESSPPVTELASVTVQRGGKTIEYGVDELIGIEIQHFVANENHRNVAAVDGSGPMVRAMLESDRHLATGLINPSGSVVPLTSDPVRTGPAEQSDELTPGFGFRFVSPVINGPGPDVVLFELQSKVNAPAGDCFHVSPLRFTAGLQSHTVKRYDITMRSAEALPTVSFTLPFFSDEKPLLVRELGEATETQVPNLQFYALVVGIDLSDLKYANGASVDGLFIQDDADDDQQMDGVFIGGLPQWREKVQ